MMGGLGGAVAMASCFLPEATIVDKPVTQEGGADVFAPGDGGDVGDVGPQPDSGGADVTSTSDAGPPPPPSAATSSLITGDSQVPDRATGTAGQRHLIYANGYWWMLTVQPGNGGQGALSYFDAPDPGNQAAVWTYRGAAFQFNWGDNTNNSLPVNGRVFGVDTRTYGSTDVLHIGLSNYESSPFPLAHTRCTVSGATLNCASPTTATASSAKPLGISTGPTTIITTSGTVADFGDSTAPTNTFSAAIVSPNTETGGAFTFGSGAAYNLNSAGLNQIDNRSTMALTQGSFQFWLGKGNTGTTLFIAPQNGATWKTGTVVATAGAGVARTFASCAQGAVGRVLDWTDNNGFVLSTVDNTGTLTPASAPQALQAVTGLVLACGPNRVHAFASTQTGTSIQGASFDPQRGWSAWTNIVSQSGNTIQSLTGFDRVAGKSKDEVGLAWTEFFGTPQIHSVIVHVTDQ